MINLEKTPEGRFVDRDGKKLKVELIASIASDCIRTRRVPVNAHPLDEVFAYMDGLYDTCPQADAYCLSDDGRTNFYKILRRRK